MVVKALKSPPTSSTASAMAEGERVAVPLKRRCSRKWDAPASLPSSSRAPVPTQKPMHTERASPISSVTRARPEDSSSVRITGVGPSRPPPAPVRRGALNGADDHPGRLRHCRDRTARTRSAPGLRIPRPAPRRRTPRRRRRRSVPDRHWPRPVGGARNGRHRVRRRDGHDPFRHRQRRPARSPVGASPASDRETLP